MSLKSTYMKVRDMVRNRAMIHQAYQSVFNTPDGQVVLKHILRIGKVTTPTFVAGDPHMTSFNEGQRRLALSILRFVRKNHDELLQEIERGIEDDQ
jgi:hypothetical protein